jgi:hypothetical protein
MATRSVRAAMPVESCTKLSRPLPLAGETTFSGLLSDGVHAGRDSWFNAIDHER